MEKFNMLLELQKSYDIIKESSKELKGGTYIYLLKKLKDDFELTKGKFKEKENEINKLRDKYKLINEEINKAKYEIEKNEFSLYNNAGSDLKLIEGLQKKIKDLKHVITELDNNSLELLELEEKLSFERDTFRVKLSELKNEFESVKETGNKNTNLAKIEVEEAQANVDKLEKLLSEDILKKFKSLKEIKGSAVAKADNGVCQGCKMRISAVTLDKINRGYNIVYCDNCGRIVYYNDKENR